MFILESNILKKKKLDNYTLIDNDKNIINFYNPNNIFILGKDDINKIKEFIDSPYIEINKDIVDYYDFEQWLKRF